MNEIQGFDNLNPAEVGKKHDGRWTWETKVYAVEVFLETRNLREVVKRIGCSIETLQNWKNSEWWDRTANEIIAAKKAGTTTKLGFIIDKAMDKVIDKLENGEEVLNNKTGQLVRKPVSLRDVNNVLKDAIDRQLKIEKETQDAVIQQSVPEILKNIALEFAKFNSKVKQNNATDIEFNEVIDNAVHDQREEGLQERSS